MKLPREVSGAQLVDVAAHHGLSREALLERLFGR
jgi:hypothetical protein